MSLIRRSVVLAAAMSLSVPALAIEFAPTGAAETADPVTHAENDLVPEGAAWTQEYFPSSDGQELHAEVLRPAHLPAGAKTPVILSVGPYFSHAGQSEDEGFDKAGPSARFDDLIDGADLMRRGYTVVLVDLRGFGGSTGCLDWLGPGEQADIASAITWSRTQPWSTGKVGMYGKSYDASTGLAGAALETPGLEAVVAQEPVWNMQRYIWQNGIPRWNHIGTPQAYNSIATLPQVPGEDERYTRNATYEERHPDCLTDNVADMQHPDPGSDYWKSRNLAEKIDGSTVPLFLTQGTTELNTMPEDMESFLANHDGPQRGWVGPFDHVRGNETDDNGRLQMGRAGWFEEVMRFYDKHLKGIEPSVTDPRWAVQDNRGTWRAEETWPAPRLTKKVALNSGTYVDDESATGEPGEDAARRSWGPADMESMPTPPRRTTGLAQLRKAEAAGSLIATWSTPAKKAVRLTGTPSLDITTQGRGAATVSMWDVAPDGTAVLVNDMISTLDADGRTAFELKTMDWTLEPGHQLAVTVGTDEPGGFWVGERTGERITVERAELSLPMESPRGDVPTQGDRAPFLDLYLSYMSVDGVPLSRGSFPLTVPQGG